MKNVVTGHKTFDKKSEGCIMTGNVISNVQFSWFVRPFNQTDCNGFYFPPGYLQKVDLNSFSSTLPECVKECIRRNGRSQRFIVYEFRHFRGRKKIIHGYVITTDEHKYFKSWVTGHRRTSGDIIQHAIRAITE